VFDFGGKYCCNDVCISLLIAAMAIFIFLMMAGRSSDREGQGGGAVKVVIRLVSTSASMALDSGWW